jgi:hypothetical protein
VNQLDRNQSTSFAEAVKREISRNLLEEDWFPQGRAIVRLYDATGNLKDERTGKNVICTTGKNQILKASAAEYLNQFAYLAIGTNSITITNATNATPIVITTSGVYSLANAQQVTIAGVLGNTAANGTNYAKTSGYTTTTLGLYQDSGLTMGVAGNGAYTSGGTVSVVPAATDTQLFNQLAISSVITPTNPSSPVLQFVNTFNAGVGTGAVAECGLFDAASSGNIISHLTFSVINKGSGDSLAVTYQLS